MENTPMKRQLTKFQLARQKRRERLILNDMLTARQAAHYKGCSEKAVYEAIQGKRLAAQRVGPVWLLSRTVVDAWVLVGHRPANPDKKTKKNAVGRSQENIPNGEG
jgi:excisionase family DNA binding protein